MTTPSVGRHVHYVSHGTPVRDDGGQAFTRQCRAAIVTQTHGPDASGDVVSLAVLNPDGMFFPREITRDESRTVGGTWHWPERT